MIGSIFAPSFISYKGLGVPVVVASTWRVTGGDPVRWADRPSGIATHLPVSEDQFTFLLEGKFAESEPELVFASGHCAKQPKSKWKVLMDKGLSLAANEPSVRAASIGELAAVVVKLRKLHRGGCHGYAANLQ